MYMRDWIAKLEDFCGWVIVRSLPTPEPFSTNRLYGSQSWSLRSSEPVSLPSPRKWKRASTKR